MFTSRISLKLINNRLDSNFYSPSVNVLMDKLTQSGLPLQTVKKIASRMNSGPFGSALLASAYVSKDEGVIFYRPVDCKDLVANSDNGNVYISPQDNKRLKSSSFVSGDILLTKIGNSIGDISVVPKDTSVCNISGNMMGFSLRKDDPYFVIAFFHSLYGSKQIHRGIIGGPMPKIDMMTISSLVVSTPHEKAQAYIGEKVRQAECLRARARELKEKIDDLISLPHIQESQYTINTRNNRAAVADLEPRLDSKFYNKRSLEILKASRKNAVLLGSLIESVSNGFEHRSFTDKGQFYITVTEVSSGRLNLQTAPLIADDVFVPQKAKVNEKCVLVVRTGSIGVAIKVFAEDRGATISSHLIRLEFETEKLAASVAAFLNSSAGKELLKRISYGAVQPQIGQDELLKLPIPQEIIERGDELLELKNEFETATRASEKLTTCAKYLVEGLIEGKITENELVAAEEALQSGERELDKAILARLTRKGMDAPHEATLFADVDALYAALDENVSD